MATDVKFSDPTTPPPHLKQTKSILERLIDSFLQESSIQWMLVIGAAIISASSLMLVTRQWTSLPIELKFLTILGYTAATYAASVYCERRMHLNTTSQVLKCLTLTLLPICFLSLAWLTGDSLSLSNSALTLLLLIPAAGLMVFAADRIFSHWLHGRQHAFVAAYMLLCLAGAMPVVNTTWLAVLFSAGFWLVMTIGVVKVNRHVFWLTEEHRLPRVFGFVPIAILAMQCVVLFVTKTSSSVPIHWLGLGLVMLAGTVLMTTKTIADVFRQRTGDLVHPLPWSIITPLLVGILLAATGVLLSFNGFSFSGAATRAVVPTAIIAAVWMLSIGCDTRHRGFVWAGLVLVAIAYQSCPTLLGDVVQTLKTGAAAAVQEERLPVAFYGLTYLPLLAGFALVSRSLDKRHRREFQVPLKQFVSGVSVFLTLLSITNLKAMFVVSTVNVLAFIIYSVVLRERRLMLAAVGCLVLSVASAVPFGHAMEIFRGDSRWSYVTLSLLGIVLTSAPLIDRFLSSSVFDKRDPVNWFSTIGQAMTIIVSVVWAGTIIVRTSVSSILALDGLDWIVMGTVTLSLFLLTLRRQNYLSGIWMWMIALASAGVYIGQIVPTNATVLSVLAMSTGVVTIMAYATLRARGIDATPRRLMTYHRQNQPFRCPSRFASVVLPLADLTLLVFTLIASVYFLPALVWATITLDVSILPLGGSVVVGIIGMGAVLFRSPVSTAAALLLGPVVAGVSVGVLAPQWFHYESLPLIYAVTSSCFLTVATRSNWSRQPVTIFVGSVWLAVIAPLAMLYLSPLVLVGSTIAITAMLVIHRNSGPDLTKRRTSLAILASIVAIQSASMLAGFRGLVVGLPTSHLIVPACVWMLAATVAAVIAFETYDTTLDAITSRRWGLVLRGFVLTFTLVCCASSGYAGYERAIIIASLVVAVCVECHTALRRQLEQHVWSMCGVIGLTVIWFYGHQQVPVPHVLLRGLCVATAAGLLVLAARSTERSRWQIFIPTASVAGLALPLFASLWSLVESTHGPAELLVVFAAAAIWFVYGRVNEARQFIVASAVMLNLGLFTLFASWPLTDPQMYLIPIGLTTIGLVELLKVDIPSYAHDPLRYFGGLAILVSPCFEILGGSWLHIVSLMILSVLVILIAIGLRLRALIHVGVAFLCVDLIAMVIRSSIDRPGMLWVTGLVVGASVIMVGATCEHYRESLLSRIRILSDELSTWQ